MLSDEWRPSVDVIYTDLTSWPEKKNKFYSRFWWLRFLSAKKSWGNSLSIANGFYDWILNPKPTLYQSLSLLPESAFKHLFLRKVSFPPLHSSERGFSVVLNCLYWWIEGFWGRNETFLGYGWKVDGKYFGASNQAKGTQALDVRGAEWLSLCSKRGCWKEIPGFWSVQRELTISKVAKTVFPWHQQSLHFGNCIVSRRALGILRCHECCNNTNYPWAFSFSASRVHHQTCCQDWGLYLEERMENIQRPESEGSCCSVQA